MLESIRLSFLNRDKEEFMKNFDIDVISKFYVEKLFKNYSYYSIVECSYQVMSENIVEYYLTYGNGKKEILQFQIEIEKNKINESVIAEAKILNVYKAFNFHKKELSQNQLQEILSYEKGSICFDNLIQLAKKCRDPLSSRIYERALHKSIRYRLTHPEIENAIILSTMMSNRAIALAKKVNNENPLIMLERINTVFDSVFVHKSYKEIRNKDKSTFPARELSLEPVVANIDELLFQYEMQGGKRIDIKCSEIALFYAAIFRLTGIPLEKSIMLLLPFHYMNYLEIGDKFYIIDVNHIVEMDSTRIYGGYDTLSGCATAEYYIDQFGNTNMPETLYESVLYKMQKQLPTMQLLYQPQFRDIFPTEEVFDMEQGLIQQDIINKFFELSSKYPLSSYTWAKYCYHTIFVTYPQTYISYSLDKKECQEFADGIKTKEELFAWMQNSLAERSIYSAKDQIMTADQVLQYLCGGKFDRAIFMYTILVLGRLIEKGNIIFTYENAYVQFTVDGNSYLYDAASLTPVNSTEGKRLLELNETSAICEWSC